MKHLKMECGSPGLWLWEVTHVLKVVGLIPSAVYWMDIFST